MSVLETIQEEQAQVIALSRALLYFIETADEARQHRAKALLEANAVTGCRQKGSTISGAVLSSGKGSYAVRVSVQLRRGIWTATSDCSCKDAERGTCKHALALAGEQLLTFRDRWSTLNSAAEVVFQLSSPLPEQAA